jgi:uncharacterized membrane protein
MTNLPARLWRVCYITSKAVTTILAPLLLLFLLAVPVLAQEETPPPAEEFFEGRVESILEEDENYQKLEILVTSGSRQNEKMTVEVGGEFQKVGQVKYQVGDEVVVSSLGYITDFVRRRPLVWLFAIFIVLVILIARFWGITSLLGMGISFLVIFKIILPQILAGHDPVVVAILGSLLIIPVTFYFSHGFNKKTTTAIGGTLISLIVAGILSKIFVELTHLTGYASDEAAFLQMMGSNVVNIKGLLLAGIIIGVLGVLDDITIAQASVVEQLRQANPSLPPGELFDRALKVGQDHIASMVNTLVLVYAGASLPLLLLFVNNPHPLAEIVNYEIVTEEIVRTLVGSIALILAVPITTFLASLHSTADFDK